MRLPRRQAPCIRTRTRQRSRRLQLLALSFPDIQHSRARWRPGFAACPYRDTALPRLKALSPEVLPRRRGARLALGLAMCAAGRHDTQSLEVCQQATGSRRRRSRASRWGEARVPTGLGDAKCQCERWQGRCVTANLGACGINIAFLVFNASCCRSNSKPCAAVVSTPGSGNGIEASPVFLTNVPTACNRCTCAGLFARG